MKIPLRCSPMLAAAVATIVAVSSYAQTGTEEESPYFGPFTHQGGYQELSLGPDAWFVAFHGTRKYSMNAVEAGWLARAAQLCASIQRKFLVELRYVGEPVFETDRLAIEPAAEFDYFKTKGSVVYIPIITSSGPQEIPPYLTPSKLAAVRCISTDAGLRPGKKAVTTDNAIAIARDAGLRIP